MQLKALTAVLAVVFASGLASSAHVKALSHTKSNIKQTPAIKTAALVVPQPVSVSVVSGDTLSSIAAKNSTTYVRLFDANAGITNPDEIQPGEVVVIPTASQQLPDRYGQYEANLTASEDASEAPAPQPVTQPEEADTSTSTQVSTPAPVVAAPAVSSASNGIWTEIAACESGGNWSIDTGNGFYGGLQFTLSSWQAMGGTGLPSQASEAEQIALAQKLQSVQGWGAWPVCSAKLGL